jgi:redox-sensitive bicupin YhaK (pirin superfamily)
LIVKYLPAATVPVFPEPVSRGQTNASRKWGEFPMTTRQVTHLFQSQPTVEGAGVHLQRAFGFDQLPRFDPFLMLDDFRSDRPAEFLAGFPWHPHRGMETITYVLAGHVDHEDSLGNKGSITAGDVQWMTAGSGIIHQEMPKSSLQGGIQGFQLWANLPAKYKRMDPRYQNVESRSIPEVELENGVRARVIAGKIGAVRGPVEDIVTDPEYLDVQVRSAGTVDHPVKTGHTVFAYILGGEALFPGEPRALGDGSVVLFGDGDRVRIKAGPKGAHFLLVSGKPLDEPIAWRGPMVMNTHAEIEAAFDELEQGTFIKVGKRRVKFA